jgi:hypothetical protein
MVIMINNSVIVVVVIDDGCDECESVRKTE